MPGARVDLSVAARLAARALWRRIAGHTEPEPDTAGFEEAIERAFAAVPPELVAERRWLWLPASEPPWRESGIQLRAGEEVSWLAVGRVHASRLLDVWVAPKNQLWARVGAQGPIVSATRDSHTLRAGSDGPLCFGNYFPNDWQDEHGATRFDPEIHRTVSGGMRILVVRWTRGAREGLRALLSGGDPLGLVSGELERLDHAVRPPPDWRYLWQIGEAEIFRPGRGPQDAAAIDCRVEGDVGILQRDVDWPLAADCELSWSWRVDVLPGLLREDSMPSHDYLSIAVEFDDGMDITYYWSRCLAPETGYRCPLPSWRDREYHVVARSGHEGLGEWRSERRRLHADYARHLGPPPSRIVRVWLIANAIFLRRCGRASFAGIRLSSGGREVAVL